ncbi:MAG: AAA family ATPase [Candidatus Bathyarchaeia archaeon]
MRRYDDFISLERELMRKEREIEDLRMELKRCYSIIEELKQGMRPIGIVHEVRGNNAYVELPGGQVYEVTIPPYLLGKVMPEMDAVLSPNKGTIVNVVEKPKERSIWAHKVEKAPRVTYEDIVGLEDELREFKKAVEWVIDPMARKKRELIFADTRLLEEAGSVLLFGPPGTGKTYMAKAVAGSCSLRGYGTSFIKIEGYEIVSKWLGQSAKNIREIFKLAREVAPSILLIDEVDAIGRARIEVTTDAGRDVQGMLNQMLVELGEGFDLNRNMVVVFATNFPAVIDPALMDRIKKIIYVRPPRTKDEVKRLFDFYVSKVRAAPDLCKDGKLSESVYDEIWSILRTRKRIYEASVPTRQLKVRDTYCITPRDVKNVVIEAATDASFEGEDYVSQERLLESTKKLAKEPIAENVV